MMADLSLEIKFKYNSTLAGISFAGDNYENVDKNIQVKLR